MKYKCCGHPSQLALMMNMALLMCGTVDVCLANVYNGVEATVEVVVTDVQNGFDLSVSSVVWMLEVSKEFQLFGGTIGRPCGLRRFVVAVLLDTVLHLKFKVNQKGSNFAEYCCSFEAKLHGAASLKINYAFASHLSEGDMVHVD
jgi:hypothetical protein